MAEEEEARRKAGAAEAKRLEEEFEAKKLARRAAEDLKLKEEADAKQID